MKTLAILATLAFVAGCAVPGPAPQAERTAPANLPEHYNPTPTASSAPGPIVSTDPRLSLNPARLPRGADGQPAGQALDRIRDPRHGLVVGLSQTARQFSRRDLVTGELTGFEIDIVRRIARELYGRPDDPRLHLVTMPTGSRLYALDTEKNKAARADKEHPERAEIQAVDLVIADVSITAARVDTYGLRFAAPYLATNSGLMVRKGLEQSVSRPEDLAGRTVCSGTGTTNSNQMIRLAEQQKQRNATPVIPVAVDDTSECLMLLQRGLTDAIFTDVLILEGFRLQDPGMVLLGFRSAEQDVAGIAMSDKDDDLVRFVNGVLERMRADGTLQQSYDTWFHGVPGLLPLPTVGYSD